LLERTFLSEPQRVTNNSPPQFVSFVRVRFCCPSTRGNYQSNVALYPRVREYFRAHRPPLLAAWGKNDPFFLPPGAEAFKRDIPEATVRFFDTGHFALETHAGEIAAAIREFLGRSSRPR
jgi:pimeloyl-ACP methyl ester carboxylesterase